MADVERANAVRSTITKLRDQLRQYGKGDQRVMGRVFKRADYNGNGTLDRSEFEEALNNCRLFCSKNEVDHLMRHFDADSSGSITYDEFIRGVMGEPNQRRQSIIRKAFDSMDRDGSGQITVADIQDVYSTEDNEKVISGEWTAEEALEKFLNTFDGARGNDDGVVTWAEFLDYYGGLSSNYRSDDQFVQMVEQAWMIAEHDQEEADIDRLEAIFIRKVREKAMGNATEERTMHKLFTFFDKNENGKITIDEFAQVLGRLQLCLRRKYVSAFFRRYDADNSGYIDFQEFITHILQKRIE